MKRLLSLTLASILLLAALSGCGGKKVQLSILETEYANEDYAIAIAKEDTDLLADINTALAELKAEGVTDAIVDKYISGTPHDLTFQEDAEGKELLVMGTNAAFPPYEYYEGNEIVGIDAEMAMAIADKLDRKLQIDHMEFDSIISAVQTGKAHMGMAGMTVLPERLENVNFSDTYATGIQVVIVREDSPIQSIDDLTAEGANYIVGTQRGTTGDTYSEDDFGPDRVTKFSTGADAVLALTTDKVDCVIIDNEPAKAYVKANNG